jgi:hypothetical protein
MGEVASNNEEGGGYFEDRPGNKKEEELEMQDAHFKGKYEEKDQWQAHFHALEAFFDDIEGGRA